MSMSETVETAPEPGSSKRQLVLHAAAGLFIAQGYGPVSMDAIARAAGVSKATLYAHFGSKDQLFATIIREACRGKAEMHASLPSGEVDVGAALTEMGRRLLSFLVCDEAVAIQRVVVSETNRFPELGRAFYDGGPVMIRRILANWLADQAAAGRVKMCDADTAAAQFCALIECGLSLRALLGVPPPPSEAEIGEAVRNAVTMFMKAYTAPECV
jgi:TetR/AcrR family transcriptional repressor of mexJK operon